MISGPISTLDAPPAALREAAAAKVATANLVSIPSTSSSAPVSSGVPLAAEPSRGHPHLLSLCAAILLAASLVSGGYFWARDMQERRLHTAAPEFCDAKLHGVALIREALSRPDTLVFFGSSELIPDVPMKGVDFFSDSPTGFTMFPVGKAGTTAPFPQVFSKVTRSTPSTSKATLQSCRSKNFFGATALALSSNGMFPRRF